MFFWLGSYFLFACKIVGYKRRFPHLYALRLEESLVFDVQGVNTISHGSTIPPGGMQTLVANVGRFSWGTLSLNMLNNQ